MRHLVLEVDLLVFAVLLVVNAQQIVATVVDFDVSVLVVAVEHVGIVAAEFVELVVGLVVVDGDFVVADIAVADGTVVVGDAADSAVGVAAPLVTVPVVAFVASVVVLVDVA